MSELDVNEYAKYMAAKIEEYCAETSGEEDAYERVYEDAGA